MCFWIDTQGFVIKPKKKKIFGLRRTLRKKHVKHSLAIFFLYAVTKEQQDYDFNKYTSYDLMSNMFIYYQHSN